MVNKSIVTGSYPATSLTRADQIYIYQAAGMVPGLHFKVLSGTVLQINQAINALEVDPYDATQDVSAQVTPAFKTLVDAAVAAAPDRRGNRPGHPVGHAIRPVDK